jgi:hypothetical protein
MARTRRKEKERMLNRCCIYVCIYVLTRWSRSYSWLGPGQSTRAIHAALVPWVFFLFMLVPIPVSCKRKSDESVKCDVFTTPAQLCKIQNFKGINKK